MGKNLNLRANVALALIFAFLANSLGPVPTVRAQEFILPAPGKMVVLSPVYSPAVLKGIKLDPQNPFRFHFFVDKGDDSLPLKQEASRLIKYFLASLTIPEKDLWVNLSPYEKDRIIPPSFGQTEMGRDLLAEDYLLKQITASLIYPESQLGKQFWAKVYAQAQAKYGTTNVPINTFNKVWIVPDKAVVYENGGTAFVLENHLKVMLEQDYLSMQKHGMKRPNSISSQIVREIVIPALTKEVNQGKNFAQLRQVFYSLILATWYKKKITDSILNKVYSNRQKVQNLSYPNALIGDPEHIYQQYLKAFKKGVYNYIKEESDPISNQRIPRKYFSGGVDAQRISLDLAMIGPKQVSHVQRIDLAQTTNIVDMEGDMALISEKEKLMSDSIQLVKPADAAMHSIHVMGLNVLFSLMRRNHIITFDGDAVMDPVAREIFGNSDVLNIGLDSSKDHMTQRESLNQENIVTYLRRQDINVYGLDPLVPDDGSLPPYFIQGRAENIPFEDNRFSWVISTFLFDPDYIQGYLVKGHPSSDHDRIMKEFYQKVASQVWRVLKPGGHFVFNPHKNFYFAEILKEQGFQVQAMSNGQFGDSYFCTKLENGAMMTDEEVIERVSDQERNGELLRHLGNTLQVIAASKLPVDEIKELKTESAEIFVNFRKFYSSLRRGKPDINSVRNIINDLRVYLKTLKEESSKLKIISGNLESTAQQLESWLKGLDVAANLPTDDLGDLRIINHQLGGLFYQIGDSLQELETIERDPNSLLTVSRVWQQLDLENRLFFKLKSQASRADFMMYFFQMKNYMELMRKALSEVGDEGIRSNARFQRIVNIVNRAIDEFMPRAITGNLELTKVDKKRTSLRDLINGVTSLMPQKNIRVIEEHSAGLDDIPIDRFKFGEVIINLVKNAQDAIEETGKPGEVIVKTEREDNWAKITISDDGPGIIPENVAKVFEPYFTTKPTGKGTGLGLSICKQIVEAHGGTIYVESELGRGTTFTIRLPADAAMTNKHKSPNISEGYVREVVGQVKIIHTINGIEGNEEFFRKYSRFKYGAKKEIMAFAKELYERINSDLGGQIRSDPNDWVIVSGDPLGLAIAEIFGIRNARIQYTRNTIRKYQDLDKVQDRISELNSSYISVLDGDVIKGKNVILIDDLLNRGTSFAAVRKLIEKTYEANIAGMYAAISIKDVPNASLEGKMSAFLTDEKGVEVLIEMMNKEETIVTRHVVRAIVLIDKKKALRNLMALPANKSAEILLMGIKYTVKRSLRLRNEKLASSLRKLDGLSVLAQILLERQIDAIALDLDNSIAITSEDLDSEMIKELIGKIKRGKKILIMTDDDEESVDKRIRELLAQVPGDLRDHLIVFTNSCTRGFKFNSDGTKKYYTSYNQASKLSETTQGIVGSIVSQYFKNSLSYDTRSHRLSIGDRVDLRAKYILNRGRIIKELQERLAQAGLPLKVYAIGRLGGIRIVRQHKEHALEYLIREENISSHNMLIMADAGKDHQVDRELLTRFPQAVSVNVGQWSRSLSKANSNIIQFFIKHGPQQGLAVLRLIPNGAADEAMVGEYTLKKVKAASTGGIDLNPAQMSMQINKEGKDFKFNFNGTEIDAAQITGATFTIRTMTPVTDLPQILGLGQKIG